MGSRKHPPHQQGPNDGSAVGEEKIYQGVIIAETFDNLFDPITIDRPKCLVPLVNRPLIHYSLDLMLSAGIQEIFILCSSRSAALKDVVHEYIRSQQNQRATGTVIRCQVFMSETFMSMGDCLRELDSRAVIKSDFALIWGDCVGNLPLKDLIDQHVSLRKTSERGLVLTLIPHQNLNHKQTCNPGRVDVDDLFVLLDADTGRVYKYWHENELEEGRVKIPLELLNGRSLKVRHDLANPHAVICSQDVPPLFSENFDYFTLDHFIHGILAHEDILGNSIYMRPATDDYIGRVDTFISYDRISKNILQRFLYPTIPDQYHCRNVDVNNDYYDDNVQFSANVKIGRNVAIGRDSSIDSGSSVVDSVIGANCKIGKNVHLNRVYIWDNVTIGDSCELISCLLADSVVLKNNVTVPHGCVVGSEVILGPEISLSPATLISSKPCGFETDNGIVDLTLMGREGRGFVFHEEDDDDDPDQESGQNTGIQDSGGKVWGRDDLEFESRPIDWNENEHSSSSSSEEGSDGEGSEPELDDNQVFHSEVLDSLLRGLDEKIDCKQTILDINSSKHAYGVPIEKVYQLVVKAIAQLPAVIESRQGAGNGSLTALAYLSRLNPIMDRMMPIIKNYIKSTAAQKAALIGLEEVALADLGKGNGSGFSATAMAKVILHLYNSDVLEEETILAWLKTPSDEVDERFTVEDQKSIRNEPAMVKLFDWLMESDEDDE